MVLIFLLTSSLKHRRFFPVSRSLRASKRERGRRKRTEGYSSHLHETKEFQSKGRFEKSELENDKQTTTKEKSNKNRIQSNLRREGGRRHGGREALLPESEQSVSQSVISTFMEIDQTRAVGWVGLVGVVGLVGLGVGKPCSLIKLAVVPSKLTSNSNTTGSIAKGIELANCCLVFCRIFPRISRVSLGFSGLQIKPIPPPDAPPSITKP